MFFFGYEAGGLCSRDVAYCIADKHGNLMSEQWFEAPYCSLMHDFAITEKYAVFPVFPTTAELDRLKSGGVHWVHQPDLESWIGIMPRYGKVEEMRWFKGPKGVSVFHVANAFDEGDKVHVDLCISETNAFPFIRAASGIAKNQWEIQGSFARWTLDLSRNSDEIDERPLGPPGDLPRVRDADQGRPYGVTWYLSMNPEGGPPLPGGPVGTAFNAMLQLDPQTEKLEMMGLPPGHAINEPVHVLSRTEGHAGWLLTVVDREVGANEYRSELWVVDAGNIGAGAVARVKVPIQLRPQVHGWWVSAEQLEKAEAPRETVAA
jgi:carotenoid cleavage dioxygenase